MHYHLCDHIYIAQFRQETILLDTKKDKYIICPAQISDIFNHLFDENEFYSISYKKNAAPSVNCLLFQYKEYINQLLADNIIEKKDNPYPYHIDKKITSQGVSNVDWRLPLENKKIKLNSQILKAFFTLIKVNFFISFKGLYHTIQLIKKNYGMQSTYKIPQEEELRDLASILNKTCLIYPTRIKCLEWAISFVLLSLKRGWKCNLEIGVQNYPFFSHAWVECNGRVVMDDEDLRKGLAIVLNEPFKRLKT